MNIKRHRVVSSESPFQHVANALKERALQCAENEGWPIPGDAAEPLLAVAKANVLQRVSTQIARHVRDGLGFWPGRAAVRQPIAPPLRRIATLSWDAGVRASRP